MPQQDKLDATAGQKGAIMFARWMNHRLLACVLVWAAAAGGARADAVVVTNDDLVAQIRAVWTKTILGPYEAAAPQDAPWDADARRFITGCIGRLADIYPANLEIDSLKDLERMGWELLAAGCNEPIIHMLYGNILYEQGMLGEALPYLQSGYENSRTTADLQLLMGVTGMRLAKCMRALDEGSRDGDYRSWVLIDMGEASGNPMYVEDDQSALLEIIDYYCFDDLSLRNKGQLVERCVLQPDSTEWLCKMLAGLLHVDVMAKSNDSRSHDMAGYEAERSSVEGQLLLQAAWEIRPGRPQAAAALVRLAAYTRRVSSDRVKEWFDLAVAAQVDYMPAYNAYILYVVRGGEAREQDILANFGRDCIANGPYDTIVPFYYLAAAGTIARRPGRQNPLEILRRPEVLSNLETMLSGYDDADISGELRTHVQLVGAAVCSLSKNWPRAREYLDAVDDLPDRMVQARIIAFLGMEPTPVIAQIYAETGPAAEDLARARREYGARRYDAALAILTAAVQANRDDPWTTVYLHHSIRHILTTRDWMAGEWINITPDVDLSGWRIANGEVWVDADGRIVCLPGDDSWSSLICDRLFGDAYEMRGSITFPSLAGPEISAGPILGLYWPQSRLQYYATLLSNRGQIDLWDTDRVESRRPGAAHENTTFHVQVWKLNITAYIGGHSVFYSYYADDMPAGSRAAIAQIGLGSRTNDLRQLAVFSDIQVRRLTDPPVQYQVDVDSPVPLRISTYSPAYGDQPVPPLALPEEEQYPEDGKMPFDGPDPNEQSDAEQLGQLNDSGPSVLRDPYPTVESEDPPVVVESRRVWRHLELDEEDLDALVAQLAESLREGGGQTDEELDADEIDALVAVLTGLEAAGGEQADALAADVEIAQPLPPAPLPPSGDVGTRTPTTRPMIRPTRPTRPRVDGAAGPVQAAEDDALFRTALAGGDGGAAFEDTLPGPGYLVGLRLRVGRAINSRVINSIQPIYRTPIGRRFGGRVGFGRGPAVDVAARDGYAVGGVVSGDAQSPGGLQIIFMRITPDGRLDADDSYRSQWYGPNAGDVQVLAGGRLVVGLTGRMGRSLEAVGLVATDEPDLTGLDIPTGDLRPAAALVPRIPADLIELDGHYYRLFVSIGSWHQAQQYCQAMGGQLVKIDSQAEDDLVIALWAESRWPVWTGAHSEAAGRWQWADGSPLDFTHWLTGHPDRAGPHQAVAIGVSTTSRWINVPDGMRAKYICEWDSDPRPPVDAPQGVLPGAVEFEGHWYRAFYDPLRQEQARVMCEAMGGSLVVIETEAEGRFVRTLPASAWTIIGAVCTDAYGWHWIDGGEMTYSNWRPGELPDYSGEELMAILDTRTGRWGWVPINWRPTTWPLGFICEWHHPPAPEVIDAGRAALPPPAQAAAAEPDAAGEYIPFAGHWYKAFYTPMTWHDAQAQCESLGGHLIYIDDEEENDFASLFLTFEVGIFWIGATDEQHEGRWRWADGSEVAAAFWVAGEPNNYDGAENAAAGGHIDGVYRWNDLPADELHVFICEWDHDPTAQPDTPAEAPDEDSPPSQENNDE